ncbi:MAG: argininosuccinate synthase domain-containing protein [Bacteroidia bacterium]
MKKVVLGFSGGLDTSYCAKYLKDELGYEVHSVLVNTGGFNALELEQIGKHAYALGMASHTTIDASTLYYEQIIRFLIYGNVLKNNTYPLSVSAERICQAMQIAEHARKLNAHAVAHGSTGAGNDQVRFDLVFQVLLPDMEIITPIRDLRLSREEEINYLKSKNVEMNFDKAIYSINKGLWGTSVGGVETLNSSGMLPESAWPVQVTKSATEEIKLSFRQGELVGVDDREFDHPVSAIQYIQEIASPFGIGRDMHVGDTIIGIKGRVGFEAAGPMLILKAHHALEKHVLTKNQLLQKDSIALLYGHLLHEGLLLDPVMRDMEAYLSSSQQCVTGEVFLSLYPYRFTIHGIASPFDLMQNRFGSYGEMNKTWTGEDVRGFTKIFGNQCSMYYQTQSTKATHEN